MAYFYPKFGLFGSSIQKALVHKCCKWSQKLLLGPLSTLDKSNSTGPFRPQIVTKRRAKLMEIWKTIYLQSTTKNLRTLFWNCFVLIMNPCGQTAHLKYKFIETLIYIYSDVENIPLLYWWLCKKDFGNK